MKKDDIVLFYFSGHGIQADGNNYLLPVGIPLDSKDEIKYKAVAMGRILDKFKQAGSRLNLVVLDASREPNGLAPMSPPIGTLIAYSTAPTMWMNSDQELRGELNLGCCFQAFGKYVTFEKGGSWSVIRGVEHTSNCSKKDA